MTTLTGLVCVSIFFSILGSGVLGAIGAGIRWVRRLLLGQRAYDDEAEFLAWVADRLEHVYGESPNIDFMIRLRQIAGARKASGMMVRVDRPQPDVTIVHARGVT